MKSTYRSIFNVIMENILKIVSCFICIFVLTISTFICPVFALGDRYSLSDILIRTRYEGDYRIAEYAVYGLQPLDFYQQGSNNSYGNSFSPAWTGEMVRVIQFPFGRTVSQGISLYDSNSPFIDITDLERGPAVTVTFDVGFGVTYKYEYSAVGTYTVDVDTKYQLLLYDREYRYIGVVETSIYPYHFELASPHDNSIEDVYWNYSETAQFNLPEDAAYIVPVYQNKVFVPDQSDPVQIHSITIASNPLKFTVSVDTILENSLTMKAIEDKLAALDDKADVIMNGSPEQNQAAQDAQDQFNSFQDDVQSNHDLEAQWFNDFDTSSDTLNNKITGFVNGAGFSQLSVLVAPIMEWDHIGTIMFLLIAFINMSIILFGR